MKARSFLLALVPVMVLWGDMPPAHAHVPTAHVDDVRGKAAATHGVIPKGDELRKGDVVREYVDVSAYLTEEADINAWYGLMSTLEQNFDDICGDTFCEGEFSNIMPLRYRCSVERTTGAIGRCVWVFAASREEISPSTGRVSVEVQSWRCKTPLGPGASIHDFLSALSGDAPLYAVLPGTDKSLYDGLTFCL